MSYWAGLFTPELQVDVAAGVDTMLAIAHKLLKKKPDVEHLQTGEDVQFEDGDEARLPSIRWKKHRERWSSWSVLLSTIILVWPILRAVL
jgi:hypothetical protein